MKRFSVLNLSDCQIGLADLLTKRHAALVSTKVGKGQEEILTAQRQDIDALPDVLTSKRPLADELGIKDDIHDGFGAAIWHTTEAYFRIPGLAAGLLEAAQRIRAAFIPELGELNASYADEAAAAARRKDDLGKLEADLKLFPIAGGGTLYELTTSFLSAGEDLSTLLSQRADLTATSRAQAQRLRSETVGILNDLRRALEREKKRSPGLPEDIDGQIFGYLDILEAQRIAANRAAKANAKKETGEVDGGGK